jgi:Family of unknown function (DUF5856)
MKLIEGLLVLRNQLKLYHWQTESHSRHEGSDRVVNELDGEIDKFVETYQGKYDRLRVVQPLVIRNVNDGDIVHFIKEMMKWLESFEHHKITDTDLLNIRDEMLATLRQGLYFFSQK